MHKILRGNTSTAFCLDHQTMSYCSGHNRQNRNDVTAKLLLISVPILFQTYPFNIEELHPAGWQIVPFSMPFVSPMQEFISSEMLDSVKTEFHLIMDDFKNL